VKNNSCRSRRWFKNGACLLQLTRMLSLAAILLAASFLIGCAGGGSVSPSFYVDIARAVGPAFFTSGEEEADFLDTYQQRAEAGDSEAQYRLGGLLYAQSRHREGRKWMCRAAENGLSTAMVKLGYWSEHDDSDSIEAVAWYLMAEKHGHPWAGKYRSHVEGSMTLEQITEAYSLVATIGDRSCNFGF